MLPENPLEFIQQCIKQRAIQWTYHINMRLRERSMNRQMILGSIETYEIIESYPDDKYLPSYLVYARQGERHLHILFATDVANRNIRIVTAYFPDIEEWEPNFKTRR